MPGARLTRLTIGSTSYGQHRNPLANQLRSRVQYEIDCPLLDYSRCISVSVVNVATTIAGKPFLTFAIVGMSVFAFSALLTGICRGNLEYRFTCFGRFVAGICFQIVPTYIEEGFVQASFLCCSVGEKPAVAVLLCLWPAGHASGFQVLEDDHFGFAVHQFPAGFVTEVIADIGNLLMLSCDSVLCLFTTVGAFVLPRQTTL